MQQQLNALCNSDRLKFFLELQQAKAQVEQDLSSISAERERERQRERVLRERVSAHSGAEEDDQGQKGTGKHAQDEFRGGETRAAERGAGG
jgi:hypothetical protein